LIAQILTDRKFGNSIIDIINPNYFGDEFLKIIVAAIIDAKKKDDIIPDVSSLEIRLVESVSVDLQRRSILNELKKIKDANLNDSLYVQDIAMKFCKQHELMRSLAEINKIISKGDIENYDECERILRKALEHGDNKDDGLNVFDNLDSVLADDFRKPIRTGIKGLDAIMDGGLSKTELAIILAPFGVGKTTMMTKIANTAMLDGNKVLQIFFEDNPKVIQRKHLSCFSKYDLNSLSMHKEELKELAANMINKSNGGELKLKKFSSDGTTIPIIRQYIRRLIASGFKPDIVILDYIDCVEPSKKFDDVNVGEGSVMRQFEAMLSDLDIAGWTAVQGNRSSIKADVVEADQMGGSIKKAQIGHFVVSIAKTLDQKENSTATMAILKSRFGQSGMIFENVIFDNATIQIEMEDSVGYTRSEHKKVVEVKQQNRVNHVFDLAIKEKNAALGAELFGTPTDVKN
jgi:replicative DNA helicase